MAKDTGSGRMNRPVQNTFDIDSLEAKSNVELLEAVDEMLARPADQVDGDFVDACLDILQDRAPVAENYDPQVVLSRLHEEHSALFEIEEKLPTIAAEPKRKRSVPLLRYMGAFAAAVLCFAVTANAFGYNPMQAFLKWVDDTIQIYCNPSGLMELPPDDSSEYHSLEEALEACGASSADRITWVPKDYSISYVEVVSRTDMIKIVAVYEADRGELAIRILGVESSDLRGIAESDLDGDEYERNGTVYYMTSNYDITKAGWSDERYSYEISGQISENEMKEIIDSIT